MRRVTRRLWPLAAALVLGGCLAVTVNVSFPQEKLDNAASSIEDLVRTPKTAPGGTTPAPSTTPGRQGALTPAALLAWIVPAPAEAQVQAPELRTRTPEVLAVIESRRTRYPQLAAQMSAGCIGENNQGLVDPRPGSACPPTVAALVATENVDRMKLYRTLVEQNNMPPAELGRVQATFGRKNREAAPPGTWVQNDDGTWVRK
jgi:uncharacterized protein YdbL (DUF1318 family)